MLNWRSYRYAVVLGIALGAVVCCLPSGAYAGGVHFGFGVDVPLPGPAPVEVYSPPVVVERTRPERVVVEEAPPEHVIVDRVPAHRIVVEQPAPRVVVEPVRPRVTYEEPVVIERRSSVTTYYRPAPRVHEYHEESEYYGHSSSYRSSSEDNEY